MEMKFSHMQAANSQIQLLKSEVKSIDKDSEQNDNDSFSMLELINDIMHHLAKNSISKALEETLT